MNVIDHGVEELIRLHDDQRGYPRVELDAEATLSTADGFAAPARIRNVSPGGVQLHCAAGQAGHLHVQPIDAAVAPSVTVQFGLPSDAGGPPLRAAARMLYVTPRGTGLVALGLQFEHVTASDRGRLDHFFIAAMEPPHGL